MLSSVVDSKKNDNSAIGCAAIIGLFAFVGYVVWQDSTDAGWIPHSILTLVTARNWSPGEYKVCSEAIIEAMKEEPQTSCVGSSFDNEPKRFKVQFYGATYKEELK